MLGRPDVLGFCYEDVYPMASRVCPGIGRVRLLLEAAMALESAFEPHYWKGECSAKLRLLR